MPIFKKDRNYYKQMNKVPPGRGIRKRKITDKERYGFKSFFISYKEKFWKLVPLNLIYVMLCLPAAAVLFAVTNYFGTQALAPTNTVYTKLYGAYLCSPSPVFANLFGVLGTQIHNSYANTATTVCYLIACLIFVTFGAANVGMTYILRAFVRGDYVYIWHDFFSAVRKNFWQSLIIGALDMGVMVMLVFSGLFYYRFSYDFTYSLMFFMIICVGIAYLIMRFYIYMLLITFKLKFTKLIKNAIILALIGIKRNASALAGIFILLAVNITAFIFLPNVGIVLPLIFLFANGGFMSAFAAYYNVKKYIIDPYYEEHPEEKESEKFTESIFTDQG